MRTRVFIVLNLYVCMRVMSLLPSFRGAFYVEHIYFCHVIRVNYEQSPSDQVDYKKALIYFCHVIRVNYEELQSDPSHYEKSPSEPSQLCTVTKQFKSLGTVVKQSKSTMKSHQAMSSTKPSQLRTVSYQSDKSQEVRSQYESIKKLTIKWVTFSLITCIHR